MALILLFLLFSPYNYLGVRKEVPYDSMPLSSMREVILKQPDKIVLGDSRMANLNPDYIEQVSGEHYTMLAFGGANVGHSIALFWFATEHTQLSKVVFGIGWYTSNGEQGPGFIPELAQQATNPIKFIADYDNWSFTMHRFRVRYTNAVNSVITMPAGWVEEDTDIAQSMENRPLPVSDEYTPFHPGVMNHSYIICATLNDLEDGYELRDDTLNQLGEVIDYCDQNGIEIVFVFPPMHLVLFQDVTGPLGIDADRERYKQYLIARATVYDFEFVNAFNNNDRNFLDAFHLNGDAKKWLINAIFADVETPDSNVIRYIKDA